MCSYLLIKFCSNRPLLCMKMNTMCLWVSHHKAVVVRVRCESHPQPHLVLSLRYISQGYPSLREKRNFRIWEDLRCSYTHKYMQQTGAGLSGLLVCYCCLASHSCVYVLRTKCLLDKTSCESLNQRDMCEPYEESCGIMCGKTHVEMYINHLKK